MKKTGSVQIYLRKPEREELERRCITAKTQPPTYIAQVVRDHLKERSDAKSTRRKIARVERSLKAFLEILGEKDARYLEIAKSLKSGSKS